MVATQSNQSFSISRRPLDVEDYIDIGRRHAGWIAGPAFFGVVVSICVALMLPNVYTSKATMQITPPQISENMVQTTISNSLNERIQQMETELLSRTSLSQIINDPHLQLYKEEQKTKPLEDVIEGMKNDIKITLIALPGAAGKRASAFDISFSYYDRFKAQQTVQMLMDKFGESNQGTQKNDQDQVNGLVGDLLTQAKADLQKANEDLTKFKEENAGKLPEEAQLNIALENGYTEKIRSVSQQIFNDREGLAQLETQRATENGRLDSFLELDAQMTAASMPGAPGARIDPELAELDKNIETLKFRLDGLKKNLTPAHPDVRNAQRQLEAYQEQRDKVDAKLKAQAEAEAAKPKEAARMTAPDLKAAQVRQTVKENLAQIDAREKALNDDIARLNEDKATYLKESDDLNLKLKASTGLQADYEDLIRSRNMAEANYAELLKKQQMAIEEGKLIQRRAGENLEVLDVASLPVEPTKPNRYAIVGFGFAASMVVGFLFAAVQETKDTSLKNLKDVRAYTNLPVLCSVPLLENTMLVKRKRRLTYLAWSAAVIVGAAAVGSAAVYYETITNTAKG